MRLEPMTIFGQFHNIVEQRKNSIAVTCEEEAYTFEELDELSDKMAIALLYEEIEKGAHFALCGKNSIEWICAFLSIVKIGAIPILINPNLKEQEVKSIFDYADVNCVYYDDLFATNLTDSLFRKERKISMTRRMLETVKGNPSLNYVEKQKLRARQATIDSNDNGCMLFTSGSTSKPKGVMISHFQLMNIAKEATETMKWTSKDQICQVLPMFHCFGLSTGLLSSFIHGGCLHICSHKTLKVMKCVDDNQCTVLNGVPSLFLAILYNKERASYDLSSLKTGIIAGSEVHTGDFLRIVQELGMTGLMQSYGQTEASPSITFTSLTDSLELRSKSVGKKISNIQLKIVDTNTDDLLQPFQSGEILIHGYNVMKGYYKNEEETKKVLNLNGWLRTGDLGYLDGEENLYITGRKKDIIIRCGENISPKEIEETLLEHPMVVQVKVFGIPAPVVQEEIAACIIGKESSLLEEELQDFCKRRLADYKVPKYLIFYQEFPVMAGGKFDIKELKKGVLLKIKERVNE